MKSDLMTYIKRNKKVWSLIGIGGISSLGPLWLRLIKEGLSPPYPTFTIIMTVIFLFMVPIAFYPLKDHSIVKDRQKRHIISIALVILAPIFFAFYVCITKAVVRSQTTADNTTLRLVIGLKRSELSKKLFPKDSDEEILSNLGWSEEGVRKGWIPWSVCLSHVFLLMFYYAFFFPIVSLISLVILFDYLDSLHP